MEFFARAIVAGLALGMPAYVLGQLSYSGKAPPAIVFAIVGAVGGFVAGLASLVGKADPLVVLLFSSVVSLIAGVTATAIPEWQSRVRRKD